MGIVLADHAGRTDQSGCRLRSGCSEARVRCDDANEKDRRRQDPGGGPPVVGVRSPRKYSLAARVLSLYPPFRRMALIIAGTVTVMLRSPAPAKSFRLA